MSTTSPSRRALGAVAVAGVAAVLLAGCSGASGGAASSAPAAVTPLASASIQLGWLPNVESMGPILAEKEGLYAKAGITDVKLLPGGPNVTVAAQIASGNALLGSMSAEGLASAVKAGAPLVAIGATYQSSSSAIITLAASGIKSPKDLEGRKFGMSQSDGPVYTPFFKLAGVDESKIEKVVSGPDPATLLSGQVDAMSGTLPNQPVALAAAGADVRTIPLADYGYNRWSDILVVNKNSLNDPQKRATIVALLKATTQGLKDAVADPAAAAQVVYDEYGKQSGLDLAQQKASAAVWAKLATKNSAQVMRVTAGGLKEQQKFYDAIGAGAKATSLYDLTLQDAK